MQKAYFDLPSTAVTVPSAFIQKSFEDLNKLMGQWEEGSIPDSEKVIKQCAVMAAYMMRIADNYKRILRYEEETHKNRRDNDEV